MNLALSGLANIDGVGKALTSAITGNAGNNVLFGSAGADTISGGAGDDTIDGGPDLNVLSGASGFDMLSYASESHAVWASLSAKRLPPVPRPYSGQATPSLHEVVARTRRSVTKDAVDEKLTHSTSAPGMATSKFDIADPSRSRDLAGSNDACFG